jgi:hypothetical protein
MKLFWTYYAIWIAAFIALDILAIAKAWRVKRIRRKQALRARREILRSFPVDARFRKVEPSWPTSIGATTTERGR